MKPFDLEAALNGAPVVTRDGREVTQLAKFHLAFGMTNLVGVVSGQLITFRHDGQKDTHLKDPFDLFMAPVKKTGWVVRHKDNVMVKNIYGDESTAREIHKLAGDSVTYHEISWEE